MGKKVLIVDDAAFMRMMLKDILQKNDFEVVAEAENGKVGVGSCPRRWARVIFGAPAARPWIACAVASLNMMRWRTRPGLRGLPKTWGN